ncbi:MAG: DUF4442 domain-containing protein [Flavobacteriaceae bacterium]|nr:DUF4442 domain-containing protein [Flavobacteriaceae bacterium]
MTVFKFNLFALFKLPSAWITGVRVKEINEKFSITTVKYRWINQNPFRSMFWAVQGMAAELSTGSLIINSIIKSNKKISMLVIKNKSEFFKKATGRILFKCSQGEEVERIINQVIETSKPRVINMSSIGTDEKGDKVSKFEFQWTILKK